MENLLHRCICIDVHIHSPKRVGYIIFFLFGAATSYDLFGIEQLLNTYTFFVNFFLLSNSCGQWSM